jgi:Putative collagen-binding domain of a collagenase
MLIGEPGVTTERIEAMRASDGSYAFVYTAAGKPINLKLDSLTGSKITAWWFDPRFGYARHLEDFGKVATLDFTPPTSGQGNDWVLVLDDAAKNYPPPGQQK